jgi:hypothetical protein
MVMLMVVIFEDTFLKLVNEIHYVSLPINTAGLEAERFILKKARQINICAYLVFAVFIICIPVYLPIFGSNREWFINDLVVEEYFGWCSNIINFIVYSTTSFAVYTSFRIAGFMFYAIVQIYLQVFLINQHILKMNDDDLRFDKMSNGEKIVYHNKIFRKLRFCIEHHVALGR